MGSVKRKYQLAKREEDILYVLWSAGRPLLASEIANDDLQLSTVHTTLKRMMRKRLVEVVDFAKSGNVFGRCYEAAITLEEYEKDKLYASHAKADRSKSDIVSVAEALLKGADNERLIQELDGLEELIKARREKIKQERQ